MLRGRWSGDERGPWRRLLRRSSCRRSAAVSSQSSHHTPLPPEPPCGAFCPDPLRPFTTLTLVLSHSPVRSGHGQPNTMHTRSPCCRKRRSRCDHERCRNHASARVASTSAASKPDRSADESWQKRGGRVEGGAPSPARGLRNGVACQGMVCGGSQQLEGRLATWQRAFVRVHSMGTPSECPPYFRCWGALLQAQYLRHRLQPHQV